MRILVMSLVLSASYSSYGSEPSGRVAFDCVEFSPNATAQETSFQQAVKKLEKGEAEKIQFKILDKSQIKLCPQLVQELEGGVPKEIMGLDISKSNRNCVFDNLGNSQITYGWVCKRN